MKIINDLINASNKSQQRAEQNSDFLRIFHNGRTDALNDAKDIVNDAFQNLNEKIVLSEQWIPVSSKKPEGHCKRVIIYHQDPYVGYVAYYSDGNWFSDSNQKIETPTHWMYIPEGPK